MFLLLMKAEPELEILSYWSVDLLGPTECQSEVS